MVTQFTRGGVLRANRMLIERGVTGTLNHAVNTQHRHIFARINAMDESKIRDSFKRASSDLRKSGK